MIKRILFASDFSRVSTRAEDYTVAIASASGASVTVLHAIEPIESAEEEEEFQSFFAGLRRKAEINGDKIATRLREAGIACDVLIETGKRWEIIVDVAERLDYDLIVLGHHAIQDGSKVYVGTTTHKVFFATDVPMMIVPAVAE